MKRILLATLLTLSLTINAQKITFTPQWLPQSQFAGYYVAQELGFYEEAGLEVEIEHSSASDNTTNRIKKGTCNAVTMNLFDAIVNISNGMEIVNVLQTSLHTGLVIVPRDKEITQLNDLRNKRVGIWHSHYNQLSQIVNNDHQLDVKWVSFIQNCNLFIAGAIDATMAMIYNEAYNIHTTGFEDVNYIYLSDYGYDFPEEGIYFTKDYIEEYPDKAKAFAEASQRGWEWAHQHPEETLDIVLKAMKRENLPVNRQHQEWMLKNILQLQIDKETGNPTFELDEDKIDQINDILLKNNTTTKRVTKTQLIGG
jgi:NitT/TauT family transport system substrate-binding protein